MRLTDVLAPRGVFGIVVAGGAAARGRRLALAALIATGLLAALAQPVTAHPSTAPHHHAAMHGIQAQCGGTMAPC